METTRQIEILKLMKTKLGYSNEKKFTCVCDTIFGLETLKLVTREERVFILNYINESKPTVDNQYAKYTKGAFWIDKLFWWEPTDYEPETKQIRIDFINELIANVK